MLPVLLSFLPCPGTPASPGGHPKHLGSVGPWTRRPPPPSPPHSPQSVNDLARLLSTTDPHPNENKRETYSSLFPPILLVCPPSARCCSRHLSPQSVQNQKALRLCSCYFILVETVFKKVNICSDPGNNKCYEEYKEAITIGGKRGLL